MRLSPLLNPLLDWPFYCSTHIAARKRSPDGYSAAPPHCELIASTGLQHTNTLKYIAMYRSSTGNLASFDEPPRGGGERWDRDRFERMRGGRGPPSRDDEHDHYRFQEHDRFPGGRRDIDIHEDFDRRGPPSRQPTRVQERDRFFEDERFERRAPPRRNDLFEERTPSEVANQALAPYRRKSVIDEDIDIRSQVSRPRKPARPQYIRRQSSLDTFDRRPLPRYGDIERHERNEYRPPANVPIPLPVRERRRSPERRRFRESDEDLAYGDFGGGRGREREEYREIEVSRNKSRVRRSKSVAQSTRSSSSDSVSEIQLPRANYGKKGKTRLPKRLVKKQAIIELGYPFEEEVGTLQLCACTSLTGTGRFHYHHSRP